MIKYQFSIEKYWRVIVFYDLDYHYSDIVERKLLKWGFDKEYLDEFWYCMTEGGGKAVTFNNMGKHLSIVIFNKHDDIADYLNSIVHEAEHVKQAMLDTYDVEDEGEPPAYTVGHLAMLMLEAKIQSWCK